VKRPRFNLMESLWCGLCKELNEPALPINIKAMFYAGAQSALSAVEESSKTDHMPPDVVLRGLLDECNRFFGEWTGKMHKAQRGKQ